MNYDVTVLDFELESDAYDISPKLLFNDTKMST
jgi:hypothetical protein